MGGVDSTVDSATWQALGITLTVVGLLASSLVWRRRGAATGIRAVAWSLLPAAAGLTGVLRLLWQIVDAVGSWALRLVFSPVVWLGIALAGVAAVLFGVSAVMRARGLGGRTGRREPLPRTRSAPPSGEDDLGDVEAILKKHGIS